MGVMSVHQLSSEGTTMSTNYHAQLAELAYLAEYDWLPLLEQLWRGPSHSGGEQRHTELIEQLDQVISSSLRYADASLHRGLQYRWMRISPHGIHRASDFVRGPLALYSPGPKCESDLSTPEGRVRYLKDVRRFLVVHVCLRDNSHCGLVAEFE